MVSVIKRGEIFLVNFEPIKGREQGGIRPALILQNDISNTFSLVTIVAAITSKIPEKEYPTNVFVPKKESRLDKDSTILLNQIRTIDKTRLIKRLSSLDNFKMNQVDLAIRISLGLK
ncbi:MAG TPA: type II toxin-antitoxin system PemK/MazF family toxin [Candidatus Nanoarchaeia archaeon]|nr:type II toxin-antitoxin system PemK/MazF family toxin [Candidatus Nanoarchaeia archaeon]